MNDVSTIYAWEGVNRKGRKVSGETSGHNPALIKALLRQQGISPGRVQKKLSGWPSLASQVKPAEIALFTRQLATLLKAGIALLQALDIIAEGFDNRHMRALLHGLKQEIAAGSSLADALQKQPRYFDELYCNLIAAGEQAGALEALLERVATHLEKSEQLKARIKKAMTYPLTV